MRHLENNKGWLFKVVFYGARDASVRGSVRSLAQAVLGKMPDPPASDAGVATYDSIELSLSESVRFLVMTAPAEGVNPAVRLLILKQCDGVVFVAERGREAENRSRFDELRSHIEQLGYPWKDIAVVVLFEGSGSAAPALMESLGASDCPFAEAGAADTAGAVEAMKAVARKALLQVAKLS